MKRGRPRKIRPELQLKEQPTEKATPQELEEYVLEANEVQQLTSMRGWQILKRDLMGYREGIIRKLAYLNPKRYEFDELRIHFLAADKMVSLVEDYKVNKELMTDYLNKLQNPDLIVPLDMDNEGASPEIDNE